MFELSKQQDGEPLRVLFLSNLYPNTEEPERGIFSHQLVAELRRLCRVTVVSPLPWFPAWLPLKRLDRWAKFSRVPESVQENGDWVYYPKYFMLPKVSDDFQGQAIYRGTRALAERLHREQPFDAILCYWLYPDGTAAARLAQRLDVPLVLSGRGCDVNLASTKPAQYKQIAAALGVCSSAAVVSEEMRQKLIETYGLDPQRVHTILNGIDHQRFHPRDLSEERQQLGLPDDEKLILFVGQLEDVKGVSTLIRAASMLREAGREFRLRLVGQGAMRPAYERLVGELGLDESCRFVGQVRHADIPRWIAAADVLTLPSMREGCPNVVLESLASGTPVVASRVGAIPDVVGQDSGILVPPSDPVALADALGQALDRDWSRDLIHRSVGHLTWAASARNFYDLVEEAGRRPDRDRSQVACRASS